jgi:dCMP deaminase
VKQKFIDYFMQIAEITSRLSSAKRLQVGAIVVKEDRIVSIGYNGMPAGWTNDCEEEVKWPNGVVVGLITKPEVIHAEANAIAKLAKSTESGNGAVMFLTHAPCIDCAKQIYTTGISKIYYRDSYKSTDGLVFLENCNVEVERWTDGANT